MDELRESLYNVESGINSLCAHLAEVAQHGSRDVRDNLIEVLHKLVSGEIVATVFADFSKPGLRKIFVIGDRRLSKDLRHKVAFSPSLRTTDLRPTSTRRTPQRSSRFKTPCSSTP